MRREDQGASASADRALSPTATEPVVSAPDGVTIPSADWLPGSFTALYGRSPEVAKSVTVVGWLSGIWALDFRVVHSEDLCSGAWSLTHIPSGYHCCTIHDSLDAAKAIAAEVAAWGDWSKFESPEAITKAFREKAIQTRGRHAGTVVFGSPPPYSQITHEGTLAAPERDAP